MAFCTNCGNQLSGDAKFCSECGSPLGTHNSDTTRRDYFYESKVHKCPECGERINSFMPVCPSCGLEFREKRATSVVHDFSIRIEQIASSDKRESLIRNFYIPNTKEDIIEFIILASSNIETDADCGDAWLAKLEQTYQKARLLFGDGSELDYVQEIYTQTIQNLRRKKTISARSKLSGNVCRFVGTGAVGAGKLIGRIISSILPVLPRVIISVGWLIAIFALIPMCKLDADHQVMLLVILIAGCFFIPPVIKCDSNVPVLITVTGLVLSILAIIPYCDNVDYQVMLIADVISSGVILVKVFKRK